MKSLIICISFLIAFIANASPYNLPNHMRGGLIYKDLMKMEYRGNDRNQTVNWYEEQLIDHDKPEMGMYRQRYYVEFAKDPKNVVILNIGGEGEVYSSPGGFIAEFGRSIGATMFTLEHRFYGQSLPGPLTNHTLLRTLTTKNAIEDLSRFQRWAQKKYFGDTKMVWVCAGGSYPGALSTFLRLRHPEQFAAAWSSSGVVNARFDFYEFDNAVLRVIPPQCADSIRELYAVLSAAWNTDRDGLLSRLGTPSYFSYEDFIWMVTDAIAMGVQYGRKQLMCNMLSPLPADPVGALVNTITTLYGPDFTASCYYSTKCLSDPAMVDKWGPGTYCWVFQTCYEWAFWQSAYPGSLRPPILTTEYFMNQCRTAWWKDILPNTYALNRAYGGVKPNIGKVIATHGSDDPWMYAGVMESHRNDYIVSIAQCDGCGHCRDMHGSDPKDPEVIKAQRKLIADKMRGWINEAKQKL